MENTLSPIGEITLDFIEWNLSVTASLVALVSEGVRNWFIALNNTVRDM